MARRKLAGPRRSLRRAASSAASRPDGSAGCGRRRVGRRERLLRHRLWRRACGELGHGSGTAKSAGGWGGDEEAPMRASTTTASMPASMAASMPTSSAGTEREQRRRRRRQQCGRRQLLGGFRRGLDDDDDDDYDLDAAFASGVDGTSSAGAGAAKARAPPRAPEGRAPAGPTSDWPDCRLRG